VAHSKPENVQQLVAGQLISACNWPDEQRDGLLDAIRARYGAGVCAIVIYGSYLRGQRDTMLDFYVLLDDYAAMRSRWQAMLAWVLSPNVYQVRYGEPPNEARAKYALMTVGRFEHAMDHDFHSYFWARFAQPSGLVYCRDDATRARVVAAISQAAATFIRRVVPCLPGEFTAADLVGTGLSLTYRCELRSEPATHAADLFAHNAAYYQSMVASLAIGNPAFHPGREAGHFVNDSSPAQRRQVSITWWLRRGQGKLLSILRVLKAALTFAGGFDYLLWKIGRHSQTVIEPTPRQRKYPLLFGWPLLWQLYRRGSFR
jgi:hypothetical protein